MLIRAAFHSKSQYIFLWLYVQHAYVSLGSIRKNTSPSFETR